MCVLHILYCTLSTLNVSNRHRSHQSDIGWLNELKVLNRKQPLSSCSQLTGIGLIPTFPQVDLATLSTSKYIYTHALFGIRRLYIIDSDSSIVVDLYVNDTNRTNRQQQDRSRKLPSDLIRRFAVYKYIYVFMDLCTYLLRVHLHPSATTKDDVRLYFQKTAK